MDNQVDKLFKDKLGSDALTPSPQAWKKLEAYLSKKNRLSLALRVAAALALFSLLTLVIMKWPDATKNTELVIKEQVPEVKEQPNSQNPVKAPTESTRSKRHEPLKKVQKREAPRPGAPLIAREEPEQPSLAREASLEPGTSVSAALPPKTEETRIVLVYSLPPIARKHVAQETAEEAGEEKRTGIQKVIDVAMDVKNSDNALGELRDAKNDLFALEFKREKNKDKKQ